MKRRVDSRICYRELVAVRTGAEDTIEDHLGAAYRLRLSIGYDGGAHYST